MRCGVPQHGFTSSFGKEIPEAEIWPLIAKPNNRFRRRIVNHPLNGASCHQPRLSAVVVQGAPPPLQVLRLCHLAEIRAILNQRARPDVASGHYTVLVDIDDKNVVFYHEHPRSLVRYRRMPYAELLSLWQPQSSASEIAGNVVIGIAEKSAAIPACEFCHTAIPLKVDCPRCKKAVGLQPAALLGVVSL